MHQLPLRITKGFIPYLILFLVSCLLYANTFRHQYALDDGMVILNNEYVLKGLSGMGDIFTKDMLESYYQKMGANGRLSGGRFRPLSVATFALEQEYIGTREEARFEAGEWDKDNNGIQDPEEDVYRDGVYDQRDAMAEGFGLRHMVNVIFYGIVVCLVFLLMATVVSPGNHTLAFIVALLFSLHPVHTEVVANVKSRDEILSLIFIITTLLMAHDYYRTAQKRYLLFTGISFLLALFSKEYGVTLFALLPLSYYLFEQKRETKNYINILLVLGSVFVVYMMMRFQVAPFFKEDVGVESEILNNPYLYASSSQAFATKVYVLLKYFLLLIIPYPLVSDYGYNSIPYIDTSSLLFWISAAVYASLFILMITFIRKRNILAFPIIFYLAHLALVSNLVGFNLGATMGERLIFHSSLGYCIALGYGINYVASKSKIGWVAYAGLLIILLFFGIMTIDRNKDWENDDTLYLADVKKQPESMALNNNAAATYLFQSAVPANKSRENEYIFNARKYALKAVIMNPNYVNALINLSISYGKLNMLDSAAVFMSRADSLYPTHPLVAELKKSMATSLHGNALKLTEKKDFQNAIPILERARTYDSRDVKILYDLGVCYYNTGATAKAIEIFKEAYKLNPNDPDVQRVIPLLK
jgi:hypothetical protein